MDTNGGARAYKRGPEVLKRDRGGFVCTEGIRVDGGATARHQRDQPPLKWSDSNYGFLPEEDINGEEEIQGGRDRLEAASGGRSAVVREQGPSVPPSEPAG